jgi:magnesium transporter
VAVFKGDLDQIQTIAEQEQPETEPKADAIRGTAAIIRRISMATRDKMEADEFKRLREDKMAERLESVHEEGGAPQYEWDGLRRRKTIYGSQRSRAMTSPAPYSPVQQHPPLGWSHIPTDEELQSKDSNVLQSVAGTIRARAKSIIAPANQGSPGGAAKVQSPMHPVQLTEIAVPKQHEDGSTFAQGYGLPAALKTEYEGSGRVHFDSDSRQASKGSLASSAIPPDATPTHSARRQFSFQNVFKRHQQQAAPPSPMAAGAPVYDEPRPRSRPGITTRGYSSPQVKGSTEEERLGLVKGDSHSMPALPRFSEDDGEDADPYSDTARYGRGITGTPPRRGSGDEKAGSPSELDQYEANKKRFESRSRSHSGSGPTPPPGPAGGRRHTPPQGGDGAFI